MRPRGPGAAAGRGSDPRGGGEQGTVGSAAAAAGIEASAGLLERHIVSFDRPYLLLVSAPSTGEPLFLAEVANPANS